VAVGLDPKTKFDPGDRIVRVQSDGALQRFGGPLGVVVRYQRRELNVISARAFSVPATVSCRAE
jgi:hypothetical protein